MFKTKFNFRNMLSSKYFNFIATTLLFVLIYGVASMNYRGFSSPQVFLNLFIDNATLIIATVATTFVLLTGGIDISIGSVVSLTCMMIAWLLQNTGIPAPLVMVMVILFGMFFGFVQGYIITKFDCQPFIITLAGQFFGRGLTAIISTNTITIDHPLFKQMASMRIPVFSLGYLSAGVMIALAVLIVAYVVTERTKFGRRFFAIGGNRQSSFLMGLNVNKASIWAYVISSGLAALAGIVYTFIMLSGYPLHAIGLDMEAITASVIGGTLMSGGVAFIPGTLIGVLIQGAIQTVITFQGTLSAWWTRIVLAALLAFFIVVQSIIVKQKSKISITTSTSTEEE